MEGWKTSIERKNKTNEKWKKKVAVFVRVKGRRDQPWTITLETVKKKKSGHGNRNFMLSNQFFLNQSQKIKCLKN